MPGPSLRLLGVLLVSACGAASSSPDAADAALQADLPPDADAAPAGAEVGAAAPPRVVIVAGTPSHGAGEHEYRAGALLLKRFLAEVGVQLDVVTGGWPTDAKIFEGARAIGFFSDGETFHPLLQGDRLEVLERALTPRTGFFCLHYAVHFTPSSLPRVLPLLGGAYITNVSINPKWIAQIDALPTHALTRGLTPFVWEEEWYYNIVFATDPAPWPMLQAIPPDGTRTTPDAAMHPGRLETLSWAYDRPDGGRAFGFTGLHFHASWGALAIRRYVTNGVLWAAGLEVPDGGAPVTLDPAWLKENLDIK